MGKRMEKKSSTHWMKNYQIAFLASLYIKTMIVLNAQIITRSLRIVVIRNIILSI